MSNGRKLINAILSRRKLLKLGVLGGGSALLASKGIQADWRDWQYQQGSQAPQSPPTTPFVEALPIVPVAQPASQLIPAPNPANHQRYTEFLPKKLYEIRVREALHSFHRELPANVIWGYNGIYPGPTFRARYGEPVLVRFYNDLPADHVGFGIPEVITHLHNGHTASESDGFPADYYPSGQFKDHHYANFPAGGDARETLGTLWYHDHRIDFTSQNIYKGLTGFYLLFDGKDSGNETDTNPQALRLPSGAFDIPMIFHDKVFDTNGQQFFDQFNLDGILGDKFVVNGKIQPFLKVARRKYRFRLLDGGPSRFYEFFLSSGQPFVQISNDGNLLPKPLTRQSIRLGVAERVDVIVDFSKYNIGDTIYLQNRLEQVNGRGPTGRIVSPGTPIVKFIVDRDAPDPSRVPATLRELPPVNLNEVVKTRTWQFDRRNGAWTVNGRFFDPNRVDAYPKRGTAEIWVFKNYQTDRLGWSHPIHVHFEEFRILSRSGQTPPANEIARKDVVRLGPNEEIRVFVRFRDFLGRHVMHCHNTIHEDHAMMVRWDIVP